MSRERRTREQAIIRKRGGLIGRKSEVPIVALKPGNAGRAKGHRFGETSEKPRARHRADFIHDTATCAFHPVGTRAREGLRESVRCQPREGQRGSMVRRNIDVPLAGWLTQTGSRMV